MQRDIYHYIIMINFGGKFHSIKYNVLGEMKSLDTNKFKYNPIIHGGAPES